jgi:hypothetical protein
VGREDPAPTADSSIGCGPRAAVPIGCLQVDSGYQFVANPEPGAKAATLRFTPRAQEPLTNRGVERSLGKPNPDSKPGRQIDTAAAPRYAGPVRGTWY